MAKSMAKGKFRPLRSSEMA